MTTDSIDPKVSVIIPVYNVEQYLKQCLDSIINQTLKEIEIICVNDASPDNSINILKSYANHDKRIKIFEHAENAGLSVARNTGLLNAKGKYVYFMDSDDLLDLKAIELSYEICEEYTLDVLTFDAEVFTDIYSPDNITEQQNNYYNRKGKLDEMNILSGKDYFLYVFLKNAYRSSVCLNFISLEIFKKNNLTFYPGILHEDELFTVQLYFASNRIMYYPKQFFKRRIRPNSIMTNKGSFKNIQDILFVTEELNKMYLTEKIKKIKKIILLNMFLLLGWVEIILFEIEEPIELKRIKQLLAQSKIWKKFKSYKNIILIKKKLRITFFLNIWHKIIIN